MTQYLDEPLVLRDKPHRSISIVAPSGRVGGRVGHRVGGARDEAAFLRSHLDGLDDELLALIRRRIALSQRLGLARAAAGGPRFVHEHELAVVRRFHQLGSPGRDLAGILVRLGR
jgi:chorismate mutase